MPKSDPYAPVCTVTIRWSGLSARARLSLSWALLRTIAGLLWPLTLSGHTVGRLVVTDRMEV